MGRNKTTVQNQTVSKPANWNTEYNNYFTIKYLKDIYNESHPYNDSSIYPPWQINTYYINESGTFRAFNNNPGSSWSEDYKNCCIFVQNDFPKCPPEWQPRVFYIKDNDEYVLTEKAPYNWYTNWDNISQNYYIQNSSLGFESCEEIFKVPDWNANISYKRTPRKDIQRSIIHTGVVVASYNNSSSI